VKRPDYFQIRDEGARIKISSRLGDILVKFSKEDPNIAYQAKIRRFPNSDPITESQGTFGFKVESEKVWIVPESETLQFQTLHVGVAIEAQDVAEYLLDKLV
jgi:hypothetical protein